MVPSTRSRQATDPSPSSDNHKNEQQTNPNTRATTTTKTTSLTVPLRTAIKAPTPTSHVAKSRATRSSIVPTNIPPSSAASSRARSAKLTTTLPTASNFKITRSPLGCPKSTTPTPTYHQREKNATVIANRNIDEQKAEFNAKRSYLKCLNCNAVGQHTLNGYTSTNSIIVKCKNCDAKTSGKNLTELLSQTNDNLPPTLATTSHSVSVTPSTSGDNSPQHTSGQGNAALETILSDLRSENHSLRKQNLDLNQRVLDLTSQVSRLSDKIEQLLTQPHINVTNAASNSTESNNSESPNESASNPAVDTIPQPTIQQQSDTIHQQSIQPHTDIGRNNTSPNHLATHNRSPISWKDVATKGISSLPDSLKSQFNKAKQSLLKSNFQAKRFTPSHSNTPNTPKPIPVPVYFANIPRGPIGALRRALLECLPKWSVLSVSFIGSGITEILCHKPLLDRLVAGMKLLHYKHLESYNPTVVRDHIPDDMKPKYVAACYRRWTKMAAQTTSVASKDWYQNSATVLLAETPGLDKVEPPARRNETSPIRETNVQSASPESDHTQADAVPNNSDQNDTSDETPNAVPTSDVIASSGPLEEESS